MRYVIPIIKSLVVLYLLRILYFVAFSYDPTLRSYSPPIFLFLLDTVTLIIHEAGHLFFRSLGEVLYFMGGSIFQVLFPAAITVFIWRRWPQHTVYTLFWTGQSMCNAAVYIADAPYKRLHLINPNLIHDWNHICTQLGIMDSATDIAAVVHWFGIFVCLFALGHAVKWIAADVKDIRMSGEYA